MNTQYDNELVLAVIIGTIVFFILAAFSISYFLIYKRKRKEHQMEISEFRNQFEKQLLQSQIEVQEQTFQQIGQELHDNVGQLLISSRMLLGVTERNMENPPDTLRTATATLGQAINELRSLSKSLDKEWLEQFNFSENMQTEVARINAGNKIKASYLLQGAIQLKPDEQIILFRIVQEAIQNAIKHAEPEYIAISADYQGNIFCIRIADNGAGFEIKKNSNGMGLGNMKHRTALLGGSIHWEKLPQGGTEVVIRLPIKDVPA